MKIKTLIALMLISNSVFAAGNPVTIYLNGFNRGLGNVTEIMSMEQRPNLIEFLIPSVKTACYKSKVNLPNKDYKNVESALAEILNLQFSDLNLAQERDYNLELKSIEKFKSKLVVKYNLINDPSDLKSADQLSFSITKCRK